LIEKVYLEGASLLHKRIALFSWTDTMSSFDWNNLEMRPWYLCLAASIVYFGLFVVRGFLVDCGEPDVTSPFDWICLATADLHQGFCTFNWDETLSPPQCVSQTLNSHFFAFAVDAVLTVVALLIMWPVIKSIKSLNDLLKTLMPLSQVLLIVFHGLLHKYYSHNDSSEGSEKVPCFIAEGEPLALWLYSLFVLLLVAVIMQSFWKTQTIALTIGLTIAIVATTLKSGDFSLPCLFASSHLLVSIGGVFGEIRTFTTPELGWAFLVATIVGLIEFLSCGSFLVKVGGHFWYDLTLHIAMIVSIAGMSRQPDALDKKDKKA
jgi:hypothetical protein